MAEPLSVTTAIITLGSTLQRVTNLLSDFKNAPAKVLEIRRDCEFTQSVLENIRQQLKTTVLPTLIIEGSDSDSQDGCAGLNLANLLQDNVEQLQLDINALLDEIGHMGPSSGSESKLGEWVAKGVVGWKTAYLMAMQQKILEKRAQLQLVQSNLQSQIHTTAALDQQAARDGVAAFLSNIFHSGQHRDDSSMIRRRISGASDLLSPSKYHAQEKLIKAVRENRKREVETLLQQIEPNFHSNDHEELYPLCIAAIKGDLAMMELLLSHGAIVNCYAGDRKTPLMFALLNGHAVAALALIRRGADISLADARGQTSLHLAVRRNLYAVVQVLLHNGADPNAYDTHGRTPLMEAVCRDDRDVQPHDTSVLRILLEPRGDGGGKGRGTTSAANPTLGTPKTHYNPVHHAAARGFLPDLRVIASSAPARLARACSAPDSLGRTPLWFAARNGRLDAARFLINLCADDVRVASSDPEDPTPLWAMVASGAGDALAGASALLAAGADSNARNSRGHTLLHRACEAGDVPLIELLLSKGGDPRVQDDEGRQPIHFAAVEGHEEAVERLLAWEGGRVDVNCVDKEGRTPVMVAAGSGHDFLVRSLVERNGADWTRRDRYGCDAFYVACVWGHVLCAAYLLGKGAGINAANHRGNTPLHAAARTLKVEAVRWLLRMGADRNVTSGKPFDGLRVAGTPAEVARAVGGETGEMIAAMIERWKPERRREFSYKVLVALEELEADASQG